MSTFKDIQGYENRYQINRLGKVKSVIFGEKLLKGRVDKDGYLRVILYHKGGYKNFLVHRLVAQHFIENANDKCQVNHINGIKLDNRIENLEWVTSKENIAHSFTSNLVPSRKGESSHNHKLTEKEILEIRAIGSTEKQKTIAEMYGIAQPTVSSILKRKSWKC